MKHILAIFTTWRLVQLIQSERAPFAVLERFRLQLNYEAKTRDEKLLKTRILQEINEAIQCKYCLSVWVGFFVALMTRQNIIYGFGYSAGSLLFGELFDLIPVEND